MGVRRQKIQLELAFEWGAKGEALASNTQGTETPATPTPVQSTANKPKSLMEEVCQAKNLFKALDRVRRNAGSPGVDGMRTDQLADYLKQHWLSIRQQLLTGTYVPQPVRRVEIDKPGGGKRALGIPCVVDRFIQQALLQVLQPQWEKLFSMSSHGFRPGRDQHGAVHHAQILMGQGLTWVVDLDLEKFFDRVNHDILMTRVARHVSDTRVLRVIRRYLQAGVLEGGLVSPRVEGTPQGGPLSPLLSNLLLTDLDQELERRGLKFVRYADDCNIYVRSQRAGQRVMASISHFLESRLKLRVNKAKSAVGRPWERKFLGFTFTNEAKPQRKISPKSIERFRNRVRELTRRSRSMSFGQRLKDLKSYLLGWRNYYGFCQTREQLGSLDCWIRRRLRCCLWKSWKTAKRRRKELVQRGVSLKLAKTTACSSKGPWPLSRCKAMSIALRNKWFKAEGLPCLADAPVKG